MTSRHRSDPVWDPFPFSDACFVDSNLATRVRVASRQDVDRPVRARLVRQVDDVPFFEIHRDHDIAAVGLLLDTVSTGSERVVVVVISASLSGETAVTASDGLENATTVVVRRRERCVLARQVDAVGAAE